MKKILIAMVLFVFVALPMSVMAMSTMEDNDLSTVTGQSGVSIGADITMNLSLGTVAWGDVDGLASASDTTHDTINGNGGWVGIQNLNIQDLRIHMRSDSGMIDPVVGYALGLQFGLGTTTTWPTLLAFETALDSGDIQASKAALFSVLATQQFLTIDIYTDHDNYPTDKTFVRIGLPTDIITMGNLVLNTGLWTDNNGAPGTYQSLGQVYIGGLQILVAKNNFVDISQSTAYAAWGSGTTSGVMIHVGNLDLPNNPTGKLMDLHFDALSWGDLDGLNGYAGGAGFVGIKNMNLAIGMDMTIDINVGTATGLGIAPLLAQLSTVTTLPQLGAFQANLQTGLNNNSPFIKDDLATILHSMGTIGATSVDIALQGTVSVSQIATQVILADNKELNGTYMGAAGSSASILGNMYISGLTLTIPVQGQGGAVSKSWVSISAH